MDHLVYKNTTFIEINPTSSEKITKETCILRDLHRKFQNLGSAAQTDMTSLLERLSNEKHISCTATSYECHWKSHYQRLNFLCFFFHYFTFSEDFVKEISKSGVVRGCRSANLEIILSVGNLKMQKLGSRFMPFSVKTAHLRGVNAIHCVHIFSMWHF